MPGVTSSLYFPVTRTLRLREIWFKMPFIADNILKEQRLAQMILHPFRCWEAQDIHRWMSLHTGSVSCVDPAHVKVTQYFSLWSSCKVFLKQNNSINHFHCQKKRKKKKKIHTWEFIAAVLDKGSDPVAAAHRLLHYNQATKLVLQAEDVQSTAQTWRSYCVHSTFCVHSTVHTCACLGKWLCETLTSLGAMVRISARVHANLVCICI